MRKHRKHARKSSRRNGVREPKYQAYVSDGMGGASWHVGAYYTIQRAVESAKKAAKHHEKPVLIYRSGTNEIAKTVRPPRRTRPNNGVRFNSRSRPRSRSRKATGRGKRRSR